MNQELQLIHRRRSNLRREILEKARLQLGSELSKWRIEFVGLEAGLERDSQDMKGGLAKAITSMPDNIQLVAQEILALNEANPSKRRVVLVRKEGTSMYHYKCGGLINRTGDQGKCSVCGEEVVTHINSAKVITERALAIMANAKI